MDSPQPQRSTGFNAPQTDQPLPGWEDLKLNHFEVFQKPILALDLALSTLLDRPFHVFLSTPGNSVDAELFAVANDRRRNGNDTEFSRKLEALMIGRATFPDNPAAANLAEKWAYSKDGGAPLSNQEKAELAAALGEKIFPDNQDLAAKFAAGCFGYTPGADNFEVVYGIFARYYSLPR